MRLSHFVSGVIIVPVVASTLMACGSGSSNATASCPTGAPSTSNAPDWTYQGKTGRIEVTGPTDVSSPKVTVSAPFSVDQTHVQTFTPAGDGAQVSDSATVSVCYMGVNGRTGKAFDSSYDRGEPAEFPLTGVIPGFAKAIAGQKVGSTVGVAIAPVDGYTTGQPSAGIEAGDTLIFAIKILAVK